MTTAVAITNWPTFLNLFQSRRGQALLKSLKCGHSRLLKCWMSPGCLTNSAYAYKK